MTGESTLGTRIKRARGLMTQRELARRIGVETQTISKYERDELRPPYPRLLAIATQTSATMEFLLLAVGDENAPGGETRVDVLASAVRTLLSEVEELRSELDRRLLAHDAARER